MNDASLLAAQRIIELLSDRRMVNIGQLAPVRKSVVVAADPFNRLLLEQAVILPRGFLNTLQVNDCFVPGLPENGDCQVLLGSKIRLFSLYFVSI